MEKIATPNSTLEAALAYAERGLPVFPLTPGRKTPLKASHGYKDATTDPERIAAGWGHGVRFNVGLAPKDSGVFVVDLDQKDGKDGRKAMVDLLDACGRKLPRTLVHGTPHGLHLIYRFDGALIKSATSVIAPGIDVKGFDGYVLAPPSVVDGKRYFVKKHSGSEILDAPDWLIAMCFGVKTERRSNLQGAPPDLLEAVNDAIKARGVREGCDFWSLRCLASDHEDLHPSAYWHPDKGFGGCSACESKWLTVDAARILNVSAGVPA